MHPLRRTKLLRWSISLEDLQQLGDGRAAGGRRGHSYQTVSAIGAANRRAPDRSITGEIFLRYQPATALHLRCDRIGDAAAVKGGCSGVGDQSQRSRQGWLDEAGSNTRRRIVGKEHRL